MINVAQPVLTIVCVTKNDLIGIDNTLRSLGNLNSCVLECVEIIVVNGGESIDSVVQGHAIAHHDRFVLLNVTDRSLYHAMNLGISYGTGDLLWMLNGGDQSIEYATTSKFLKSLLDLYNAKSIGLFQTRSHDNYLSNSNWLKLRFVHQGVIYPRRLHEIHGPYIEWKKFTASDYLFFLQVFKSASVSVVEFDYVISKISEPGLSAKFTHYASRDFAIALESHKGILFLFGKFFFSAIYFYSKLLFKFLLPRFAINMLKRIIR